jgi:hypothetical protein
VENNSFSNHCFSEEKKIPSIMTGTNLENTSFMGLAAGQNLLTPRSNFEIEG